MLESALNLKILPSEREEKPSCFTLNTSPNTKNIYPRSILEKKQECR